MDPTSLTVVIAIACLAIGALVCWLMMRGREVEHQGVLASYEKINLQAQQLRESLELAQKEQARLAGQAAQALALEARLLAMHDQESAEHAAAAQANLAVQTALDLAIERGRQTEQAYQEAVSSHQEFKLEAAQWRQALDQAQNDHAQLAEQAAQLPALQAQLDASSTRHAETLRLAAGRLAEVQVENASLKENAATVAALLAEYKDAPAIIPESAQVPTGPTQLPVLEKEVVALQSLAKTIQQEFQLFAEMQRIFTLTSTTVHDFSDDEPVAEAAPSVAT